MRDRRPRPGPCRGNHKAALRKEVEERRIRDAGCLAVVPLVTLLFKTTGGSSTEVAAKYVEKSEPISVTGLLLSVLRRDDGLVEVRLRPDSGSVTPNRALLREPARTGAGAGPAPDVPLSEMGEFVMGAGRFEARGSRGETLVMRAPCSDGGPAAHLRVVLRPHPGPEAAGGPVPGALPGQGDQLGSRGPGDRAPAPGGRLPP
ncbi:hypothetical protein [Streptomyces tricolor]